MKLSYNGLKKLELWESKNGKPELTAYQDETGTWTIGYGFTQGVKDGDTITEKEADLRLGAELMPYEAALTKAITSPTTQNQFDSMIILAWNIGLNGFLSSSLLRAHNAGDYASAARAFGLWNKVTVNGSKVVSNGLVNRRAKEVVLYTTGEEPVTVPQAVDPPKPVIKSTINAAQVIGGGTAAIATATQVLDQINKVHSSVSSLGDWMLPVLGGAGVLAAAYTIYARWQHSKQGNV